MPLFIYYKNHFNAAITARVSIADLPFALLCRTFIDEPELESPVVENGL